MKVDRGQSVQLVVSLWRFIDSFCTPIPKSSRSFPRRIASLNRREFLLNTNDIGSSSFFVLPFRLFYGVSSFAACSWPRTELHYELILQCAFETDH